MIAGTVALPSAAARSASPAVRNPVLALSSAAALAALPPESRAALRAVMLDLRAEADGRAQDAWSRRKGPMAAYWRAAATYAGHIARSLR